MATAKKKPAARKPAEKKRATPKRKTPSPASEAGSVLASLERMGEARILEEMGPRYGITAQKAWGVPIRHINALAKEIGFDHKLALELWETGWYEARLLASMIGEADKLTSAQMDAWRRDFDNWGVVDTVCFKLFDRSPLALDKVRAWAKLNDEFGKRASFALLACVALHRKDYPESAYVELLPLCAGAASDGRNFVKKGVIWALKAMGQKPMLGLKAEVRKLAQKLAASTDPVERSLGKEVVRELAKKA
jgi:3-methyladenine DNA glycosylase AlkD